MNRSPRSWMLTIWLVGLLIVGALVPGSSAAQEATPDASPEPPAFVLEPSEQDGPYFDITQEPGTTQELTVTLGNAGEEPVTALTYAADAYTLVNGGFGVRTADDEATGPTTWIDYPTETLDLEPGDRLERTFTVSVPADTPSGQYLAGLAIQTAESIAVADSEMFRQIIKKSIAVFITVPGPESPELAIGAAHINQSEISNSLVLEIQNPGNVYLNPAGTVTVTTEAGDPVLTAPVEMDAVYAGDTTTLEIYIPTQLLPDTYLVSTALTDEDTGASAEVVDLPVTVEATTEATPEADPLTMDPIALEPLTDPGTEALQAVVVSVTVNNPAEAIPGARLTLHVSRDGEPVEDYPLGSSLALPPGETEIQQRYIPLAGWEPGEYTFAFTLEAVDPGTGQVTVLATHEAEETIEVP